MIIWTEEEARACGFANAVEMQAASDANDDAQAEESIRSERAAERRFSEWLAFPGDR